MRARETQREYDNEGHHSHQTGKTATRCRLSTHYQGRGVRKPSLYPLPFSQASAASTRTAADVPISGSSRKLVLTAPQYSTCQCTRHILIMFVNEIPQYHREDEDTYIPFGDKLRAPEDMKEIWHHTVFPLLTLMFVGARHVPTRHFRLTCIANG